MSAVGWAVILLWFVSLGIGVLAHRVPISWPGAILVLSSIGFLTMLTDKRRAGRNRQRIPERVLLSIGALGGFPGVWLGIVSIRHKSSKPSFLRSFWGLTGLHMSLTGLICWLQNHR